MNPAYYWLAAFLLAPIAAVALVQLLVVGRISGKITAGWAGLAVYLLAGNGMRLVIGVNGWSIAVGLIAALGTGIALRAAATRQRRSTSGDASGGTSPREP